MTAAGKLCPVEPEAGWAVAPGLCGRCEYALVNTTRRGTTYLRCGRAAWDERLVRYPRLPVQECVGFRDKT